MENVFSLEDQAKLAEEMQAINWNDPTERYAVAETIVKEISDEMEKNDLVRQFADIVRFKLGDTMQFATRKGAKAYVKAPGAAAPRSTIVQKILTIDAEEVSVMLEFELDQLKAGRYGGISDVKNFAKEALLTRKYKTLWDTMTGSVVNGTANDFDATTSGVQKKFDKLNDAIDHVEDQIGGVKAIVGRRTDLSFLLRFGQSSDVQWSEKAKDRIIGGQAVPSFRGYPIILLNNWKDDYNVDQITAGSIMVLSPGTVKLGVQRNVDALEGINVEDRMWEIHMSELYGPAVFFPARNAKMRVTV